MKVDKSKTGQLLEELAQEVGWEYFRIEPLSETRARHYGKKFEVETLAPGYGDSDFWVSEWVHGDTFDEAIALYHAKVFAGRQTVGEP